MNPKKILFFVTTTSRFGGYETEIASLCNQLHLLGHQVLLLNNRPLLKEATTLEYLNPQIPFKNLHQINVKNAKYRLLASLSVLKSWLQNKKPAPAESRYCLPYTLLQQATPQLQTFIYSFDLVYLLGQPKIPFANMIVLAKQAGKKILYHDITPLNDYYIQRADHQPLSVATQYCHALVGCSVAKLAQMQKYFAPNVPRYHLEQWAYETEDILYALPFKPHASAKHFTFGIMCRLDGGKGLEETFEKMIALQLVAIAHGITIKCVLTSTGSLLPKLKEMAATAPGLFTFLGLIPKEEVPAFFYDIDAFINASLEEGGPIVGLEAMAAGNFVITSAVGSMPERIGPLAKQCMFAPGNWNELYQLMHNFIFMPLEAINEVKFTLKQRYHQAFSLAHAKADLARLIEEVMEA